jgi:hypothetical protein
VYAAEIESGELKIDDESQEASWAPLKSAVELPLAESQRRRLKDVVEYQKERHQDFSAQRDLLIRRPIEQAG